jgi:hypothetical protein
VSARDDILTGKWQEDADPKRQALLLGELLDRVEREHAHRLAEVLRDQQTELTDSVAGWFAIDRAADLIDPEEP